MFWGSSAWGDEDDGEDDVGAWAKLREAAGGEYAAPVLRQEEGELGDLRERWGALEEMEGVERDIQAIGQRLRYPGK